MGVIVCLMVAVPMVVVTAGVIMAMTMVVMVMMIMIVCFILQMVVKMCEKVGHRQCRQRAPDMCQSKFFTRVHNDDPPESEGLASAFCPG